MNSTKSSPRNHTTIGQYHIEDLADFCTQWPEIRKMADYILKDPKSSEGKNLIFWLRELADHVHYSDLS